MKNMGIGIGNTTGGVALSPCITFNSDDVEPCASKEKHLLSFFYMSPPSIHDTWSRDVKTKLPSIHMGQQGVRT